MGKRDAVVGGKRIHEYMGLSYASYLVLPRSVLQSMPETWQDRFVELLEEADQTAAHLAPDGVYDVRLRSPGGRFVRDPLADYQRGRRDVFAETSHDP